MTLLDDLRELAAEFRIGGDEFAAVRLETVLAQHEPTSQPDTRPRLTERQCEILAFIAAHVRAHSIPPTYREIGERFGMRSTNGVADHLKLLERKGYLERGGGKSRALRLVDWS